MSKFASESKWIDSWFYVLVLLNHVFKLMLCNRSLSSQNHHASIFLTESAIIHSSIWKPAWAWFPIVPWWPYATYLIIITTFLSVATVRECPDRPDTAGIIPDQFVDVRSQKRFFLVFTWCFSLKLNDIESFTVKKYQRKNYIFVKIHILLIHFNMCPKRNFVTIIFFGVVLLAWFMHGAFLQIEIILFIKILRQNFSFELDLTWYRKLWSVTIILNFNLNIESELLISVIGGDVAQW